MSENIEEYRRLWLETVSKLDQAQTKIEKMREVVIELYYSSFWDSDRLQKDTAGYLWTKIKKEFELNESGPARIHVTDPKEGD